MENQQKSELNRLAELSNTIKAIFVVNGGKAVPLAELVEKLRDEDRGKYFSATEIEKSLEWLMKVAGKWIKKVETGRATFVKIEKNVSMADVKKMIGTGGNEAETSK